MGSGAGFPGLVLAMAGVRDVHLIESDIRKTTFLREVSRETGTPVTIHDERAEDTNIDNVDVITARALAPLKDLLALSSRLATSDHPFRCLFLKGELAEEEIAKAEKKWRFLLRIHPSMTESKGKILEISNLQLK
jgi:16S rRNA (guanine527-N7)-methyltransferase